MSTSPRGTTIWRCTGTRGGERPADRQRLDHIGFIIDDIDQVDVWYAWLRGHGVFCLTQPRTHRDGARSFYCHDPDGNAVQIIHHPPLAGIQGHRLS